MQHVQHSQHQHALNHDSRPLSLSPRRVLAPDGPANRRRQFTRVPEKLQKACTMVKRRKEEEIVGVLEFEGRTSEDPEVMQWLAEHRARNGGKIRVGQGSRGLRVAFSKQADMALWQARSEQGRHRH